MDEVKELRRIKEQEKFTYQEMANTMDVHAQSVFNWIGGSRKPSKMARRIIRNFIIDHEGKRGS